MIGKEKFYNLRAAMVLAAAMQLGVGCSSGIESNDNAVQVPELPSAIHVAGEGGADLQKMHQVGIGPYFNEDPIPKEGLRLHVPKQWNPQPGQVPALLEQVAAQYREQVIGLDLTNAKLRDDDLAVLKRFPHLKELILDFNLSIGAGPLADLVRAFPSLKILSLVQISIKSADEHVLQLTQTANQGALKKIRKLSLRKNRISAEALHALLVSLPKLRDLDLGAMNLSKEHVDRIIEAGSMDALSKIKRLDLGGIKISEEDLTNLLTKLPNNFNPESLILEEAVEEGHIKTLEQAVRQRGAFQHLRSLDLRGNKKIQAVTLARFVGALPVIEQLDLRDMKLTDDHMVEVAKVTQAGGMKTLQTLKLEGNKGLTDEKVINVVKGLPNLRKVTFLNMHLSDKAVRAWAEAEQNLDGIDLSGSELSPEALLYLVHKKPGLKHLNLFGTHLTDPHLNALEQACAQGFLRVLESLNLGGQQAFSANALGSLAARLPVSLRSLGFGYGNLQGEHVDSLLRAAQRGALSNLCNVDFGLGNGALRQDREANILCALACRLPSLEHLGLYCVATNPMLQQLIHFRQNGKLSCLKSINIMECGGIQPQTLGELNAWFPEQRIGYYGMGLTDAHANELGRAARGQIRPGVFALQNETLYNANNNPFSAHGLAHLLKHLPALNQVELSDHDLTTDKLLAVAELKQSGKGLRHVWHLNLWQGDPKVFTPESLVALLTAFEDLSSLNLAHMDLPDEYVKALAQAAHARRALQHITSFQLHVGSKVTPETLAKLIQAMPRLTRLGLTNGFTNKHLQILNDVAWQDGLPAITSLDLSDNPELTDYQGLLELVAPLPGKTHLLPQLQNLVLKNINLDEQAWLQLLEEALPNVDVQSK